MTSVLNTFNTKSYVKLDEPHERIAARRVRLARRLENIRRLNQGLEGEVQDEEVEEEKTFVQRQIEKSAEVLEKLALESEEIITNVRVANDGREVDRRENEGVVKEKILEQLEEEAEAAQEMFNEIANRWTDIYNYSDPLAIHEELISQKEKCDELIKQKDSIIAVLKEDVKRAERQFCEDQAKQNEDIATLAHRIEKQVFLMRNAYKSELAMMENVIAFDRNYLIKTNDAKWEDLYEERDALEESNVELRYVNDQQHIVNMILLRINHEETYRKTRIELETDINKLQQELECIKAICLVNSEKLDYNYQILARREDENLIIKSQQKRRLNKLSDLINIYKQKIAEYASKGEVEAKRLQEQVLNLRKGVNDTKNKLKHFSKTNDIKYKQIWDLNYEKAERILKRILEVDRVLYEQQLGREWKAPEFELLKKMDLRSYKYAIKVTKTKNKSNIEPKKKRSSVTSQESQKFSKHSEEGRTKIQHNKYLQTILKLISDKSGFLVEGRLKVILRDYLDYRYLVRIDSLFTALGVSSKEDIDNLIQFFLPYSECRECQEETGSDLSSEKEIKIEFLDSKVTYDDDTSNVSDYVEEGMRAVHEPNDSIEEILMNILPQPDTELTTSHSAIESKPSLQQTSSNKSNVMRILCYKQHPLVMNPGFVLRALSEFMKNFYERHGMTNVIATDGTVDQNATVSRLMTENDVLLFWHRFKKVFSSSKEQLWNGLLIGIQKYLNILKDRKKMNDDVMSLRRQNLELKHLLASYIKEQKQDASCKLPRERPVQTPSGFSWKW